MLVVNPNLVAGEGPDSQNPSELAGVSAGVNVNLIANLHSSSINVDSRVTTSISFV